MEEEETPEALVTPPHTYDNSTLISGTLPDDTQTSDTQKGEVENVLKDGSLLKDEVAGLKSLDTREGSSENLSNINNVNDIGDFLLSQETENIVTQKIKALKVVEHGSVSSENKGKQGVVPAPARIKVRSSDPKEGVDLAIGNGPMQNLVPITVSELFKKTVKLSPYAIAMKFKSDSDETWNSINYSKYYELVVQAAKYFIKLGLEEFHSVCILGSNSPEWIIASLGAIFAQGIPVGMYTTNPPETCYFIASNSKANVIIVEDKIQLENILQIRDRLPHLKAIVQYKNKISGSIENVYTWKQFMNMGEEVKESVVDKILDAQKPEQCALLIYTSGTTGNPKAAMISHDNLTWSARCMASRYEGEYGGQHIISYLPSSHIVSQMTDIYIPITIQATLHFAQPDALKGALGVTLREVMPTIFYGAPLVYEKIMEAAEVKLAGESRLKKKIVKWAAKKGIEGNTISRMDLPTGWLLADKLVFKRIKKAMGFQRCKIFFVAGAATPKVVHEFFMAYNMPLMELYGMTETCGQLTGNFNAERGLWKTGSCGVKGVGIEIKIDKPNKEGEGEICSYGRQVFMGYLNNKEYTKAIIDDEGWQHSGDIGKIDKDGFLFVTGRIKDVIKTSAGRSIPPLLIENSIKSKVPFLSNVFVIGEGREYLTCMVTLLCKIDYDSGYPLDELSPLAQNLLVSLGCNFTKVSEILARKPQVVYHAIKKGLDKAFNESIINTLHRVRKFVILPKDFSIAGGELGPTMKVMRPKVLEKYASVINLMYSSEYDAGNLTTP